VVAEVAPNGKKLSRAWELAALYRGSIVREVGYGLSLEGAPAADLVKAMQANAFVGLMDISQNPSNPHFIGSQLDWHSQFLENCGWSGPGFLAVALCVRIQRCLNHL
jgi:hypothetical protein